MPRRDRLGAEGFSSGGVDGMAGGPTEKELDVSLALAEQVTDLKRRVTHLETLEGGGGLIPLDKVELTGAAASVTFSDISGIYTALKLIIFVRTDRVNARDQIDFTFNDDVGANYNWITTNISHAATLATDEGISGTEISSFTAGSLAPEFAEHEILIPNYASSSRNKVLGGRGGRLAVVATGDIDTLGVTGYWLDTDPITKIAMVPAVGANFEAGSRFYLYGLMKPG